MCRWVGGQVFTCVCVCLLNAVLHSVRACCTVSMRHSMFFLRTGEAKCMLTEKSAKSVP